MVNGLALLEECDWSKFRELEFQERLREKTRLMSHMGAYQCTHCPDLPEHYGIIHGQRELQVKMEELRHIISDQNLELLPDYELRINVLKSLNYVDMQTMTVQLKGRVACEVQLLNLINVVD